MNKTTSTLLLLAGLAFAAVPANAQPLEPPLAFVNVNVAGQLNSRAIANVQTFEVYGETATVTATQDVDAGVLFDISGGYRVYRGLAIALGVSRFGSSGDTNIVAIVPHPAFPNEPATVNVPANDLDRTETGIHIQAVWFVTAPDFLPDEIRVALFGGPSIFRLRQQLASAIVPAGTQDAVAVVSTESETGVGFNAGADVSYPLTPLIGVGGFIRYAGAGLELSNVSDANVGGLQIGAGVRFTF